MKNIIIGYGEVGHAIEKNLKGIVYAYNENEWDGDKKCDILHVCIPYNNKFVSIVKTAIDLWHPYIIIIHSTIKPGTTNEIKYIYGDCDILYSPVMGRHSDDFENNVKIYMKYFAGDKEIYNAIKNVFDLPIEYWGEDIESLEYAKIMSTSYMYWCLLYQKWLKKDCDKMGYDYDKVYHQWGTNYNMGISVKHPYWVRPLYEDVPGKVGGHCLPANIYLVENDINNILKMFQEGREILYYVTKDMGE